MYGHTSMSSQRNRGMIGGAEREREKLRAALSTRATRAKQTTGFLLSLCLLELQTRKYRDDDAERHKDPTVVGQDVEQKPVLDAVVTRVSVARR